MTSRVAVAMLTAASLLIRAAIAFNGGLWRDEALFLGVVRLPTWEAMTSFLVWQESHPPLFYALMRLWTAVAGSSDSAALWLPILIGAATVPLIYAIGTALFNSRAGLVAAVLATLSPPLNEYGSSLRPYSLLPIMVLVSSYVLVIALERQKKKEWIGYAFVAAAMAYTHNWAWVVIGAQAIAVAAMLIREPARRGPILKGSLIAAGIVLLSFLPWINSFLIQVDQAGHSPVPVEGFGGWLSLVSDAVLLTLQATLLPTPVYGREIVFVAFILAIGIVVAGYLSPRAPRGDFDPPPGAGDIASRRHGRDWLAVRVFLIVIPASMLIAATGSVHSNLLPGRCLMMLSPLVFLLIASPFDRVLTRSRGDRRLRSAAAAVAITLIGAYTAGLYDLMLRPRSNAREITAWVERNARADDLVIVAPGWLVSSFNHYSRLPARVIAYPDTGSTTLFDFSDVWSRMSDSLALAVTRAEVESASAAGKRVWLVTDDVSRSPITDTERDLAKKRVVWATSRIRVGEIRGFLVEILGAPRQVAPVPSPKPIQEVFVAELFEREPGTPDSR